MRSIGANRYRAALRAAHRLQRGLFAGARDARSRVRVKGDGELAGLADMGLMRNYDQLVSLRERRPVYRARDIAVDQEFEVLLDVGSCDHRSARERYAEVADALLLVLLAIPGATVHLSWFGLVDDCRRESLSGFAAYPRGIESILRTLGSKTKADGRIGALRRVLGDGDGRHRVVLTYWMSPAWMRALIASLGTTLVVPERPLGGARRGGIADPLASLGPAAARPEGYRRKQSELFASARAMRFRTAWVPEVSEPLEALVAASQTTSWSSRS